MYSLFALLSISLAGLTVQPAEDQWTYESIYNPVAETRIYIAKVRSGRSEIELRCSALDTRTEVRVLLPSHIPTVARAQQVQVQFDNRQPRTVAWQPSINGASLQIPWSQVDWFSRQLSAYNTVQIELEETEGVGTALNIPLRRSSKAIANLRQRCKFK